MDTKMNINDFISKSTDIKTDEVDPHLLLCHILAGQIRENGDDPEMFAIEDLIEGTMPIGEIINLINAGLLNLELLAKYLSDATLAMIKNGEVEKAIKLINTLA